MRTLGQACIALALVMGCAADEADEQLSVTSSSVTTIRGITSANGEIVKERRGRHVVLGAGPAGGPIDPAHYGMCGFVHIDGWFDKNAIAEIVLDASGYYAVDIYEGRTERPDWVASPTVDVECIFLSEFTGVPPNPSAVSTYDRVEADLGGSAAPPTALPSACVWAGFRGALAPPDTVVSAVGWDGAWSALNVQSSASLGSLSSSAWCMNYVPEHQWSLTNLTADPHFALYGHGRLRNTDGRIPTPADAWCYIEGIGQAPGQPYTALYDITGGRLGYDYDVLSPGMMWVNCIDLNQ